VVAVTHTVYEKPGCHAIGTYEEAVRRARFHGQVAIMECPVETPYDTGWHVIALEAVGHYQAQGYILRAKLVLTLQEVA
jgi:hypothetical protein